VNLIQGLGNPLQWKMSFCSQLGVELQQHLRKQTFKGKYHHRIEQLYV
jgi:hypothetical protein